MAVDPEEQVGLRDELLALLNESLDVCLSVEHNFDGGRLEVEVRFRGETVASDTISLSELESL